MEHNVQAKRKEVSNAIGRSVHSGAEYSIWTYFSQMTYPIGATRKSPKNQKITGNLNGFGYTIGYKTKWLVSICSKLYKISILYSV